MHTTQKRRFGCDELVEVGEKAVNRVLGIVRKQIVEDPEASLESIVTTRTGKTALHIDKAAEQTFKLTVCSKKPFDQIQFFGEERLGNLNIDLTESRDTCLLVDAVDGTDLLERDLSNWCSAAVFFTPSNVRGKRIQAVLVGLPNGAIYHATADVDGVFVRRRANHEHERVPVLKDIRRLADASVCFYGQKPKNLNSFLHSGLMRWIEEEERKRVGATKKMRIYNLAGIPMMVKMIDPGCQTAASIDAVFELHGQWPHDVVAGAFLGLKAGGCLRKPDGAVLGVEDLEDALLRPNSSKLSYVLARGPSLAEELVAALASTQAEKPSCAQLNLHAILQP